MVSALIEFYDFGVMVLDGKRYASDIVVFPDKVISGWWMGRSRIYVEDLKEVLSHGLTPGVLGIGRVIQA